MMNEATMEVAGEGNISWPNEALAWRESDNKFVFVIKNCIMSPLCPPWTILMNSNHKFSNIRIEKGVEFAKNIEDKDLEKLWGKLGATVEWLHYNPDTDCDEFMKMFRSFKILKSLECCQDFILRADLELSGTVETLKIIDGLTCLQRLKEKGIINQLKVLTTDVIQLFPPIEGLEDSTVDEDLIKVEIHDLIDWPYMNDVKFFLIPGLNLLEVEIIKAEHITKIVQYADRPDRREVPLWFFKKVNFANYHDIELEIDSDCICLHEVILVPSVEKVKLYFDNVDRMRRLCTKCLQSILKSCPNCNSWTLRSYEPPIPSLAGILNAVSSSIVHLEIDSFPKNMTLNCPKLESIDITLSKENLNINSIFVSSTSNLKKVQFENLNVTKIPFDQFLKFLERTPNVTEAKLGIISIEVIKAIQTYWPIIKVLSWKAESNINDKELVESIGSGFKKLISLGPTRGAKKSKELGLELYKKVPTLGYSHLMDYKEFCVAQYNVKLEMPKPNEYFNSPLNFHFKTPK